MVKSYRKSLPGLASVSIPLCGPYLLAPHACGAAECQRSTYNANERVDNGVHTNDRGTHPNLQHRNPHVEAPNARTLAIRWRIPGAFSTILEAFAAPNPKAAKRPPNPARNRIANVILPFCNLACFTTFLASGP